MQVGHCAPSRRETVLSADEYEALKGRRNRALHADRAECADAAYIESASRTEGGYRVQLVEGTWKIRWGVADAPYPVSGLYRNDGSLEPLWSVPWYSFSVAVADDGEHLVRYGPWPSSTAELAVAFYRRGELIRAYRIDELVRSPEVLPRSVSPLHVEACDTLRRGARPSRRLDPRWTAGVVRCAQRGASRHPHRSRATSRPRWSTEPVRPRAFRICGYAGRTMWSSAHAPSPRRPIEPRTDRPRMEPSAASRRR